MVVGVLMVLCKLNNYSSNNVEHNVLLQMNGRVRDVF